LAEPKKYGAAENQNKSKKLLRNLFELVFSEEKKCLFILLVSLKNILKHLLNK